MGKTKGWNINDERLKEFQRMKIQVGNIRMSALLYAIYQTNKGDSPSEEEVIKYLEGTSGKLKELWEEAKINAEEKVRNRKTKENEELFLPAIELVEKNQETQDETGEIIGVFDVFNPPKMKGAAIKKVLDNPENVELKRDVLSAHSAYVFMRDVFGKEDIRTKSARERRNALVMSHLSETDRERVNAEDMDEMFELYENMSRVPNIRVALNEAAGNVLRKSESNYAAGWRLICSNGDPRVRMAFIYPQEEEDIKTARMSVKVGIRPILDDERDKVEKRAKGDESVRPFETRYMVLKAWMGRENLEGVITKRILEEVTAFTLDEDGRLCKDNHLSEAAKTYLLRRLISEVSTFAREMRILWNNPENNLKQEDILEMDYWKFEEMWLNIYADRYPELSKKEKKGAIRSSVDIIRATLSRVGKGTASAFEYASSGICNTYKAGKKSVSKSILQLSNAVKIIIDETSSGIRNAFYGIKSIGNKTGTLTSKSILYAKLRGKELWTFIKKNRVVSTYLASILALSIIIPPLMTRYAFDGREEQAKPSYSQVRIRASEERTKIQTTLEILNSDMKRTDGKGVKEEGTEKENWEIKTKETKIEDEGKSKENKVGNPMEDRKKGNAETQKIDSNGESENTETGTEHKSIGGQKTKEKRGEEQSENRASDTKRVYVSTFKNGFNWIDAKRMAQEILRKGGEDPEEWKRNIIPNPYLDEKGNKIKVSAFDMVADAIYDTFKGRRRVPYEKVNKVEVKVNAWKTKTVKNWLERINRRLREITEISAIASEKVSRIGKIGTVGGKRRVRETAR